MQGLTTLENFPGSSVITSFIIRILEGCSTTKQDPMPPALSAIGARLASLDFFKT